MHDKITNDEFYMRENSMTIAMENLFSHSSLLSKKKDENEAKNANY